jgi:hypothetical protein
MENFDLISIIKKIRENETYWRVDSRSWEDRISSIKLTWLPDFAQETYSNILKKIYIKTENANPIRDLIFHIAAQKLAYRAIPWSDPQRASMVQINGFEESSVIVAQTENHRSEFTLVPHFCEIDIPSLVNDLNNLRIINATLNGKDMIIRRIEQLEKISLVHICCQVSLDIYTDIWRQISPKIISSGIAIFSGDRHIIYALEKTLKISHSNWYAETVPTVRMQKDGPDNLEGILVMVNTKLEQDKPIVNFGDPAKKAFKKTLTAPLIIPNLDHFQMVKNFDVISDSTVIDISDSNIQMESKCLAVVGYNNISINEINNFSGDAYNKFSRFCQPFGKYVCFEKGRIANNLPIDSMGRIPFQSIQLSMKSPNDPDHLIWGTTFLDLPKLKLEGLWFHMPSSSNGFSHWMIESFLPLLVAQEFGLKCNVICNGPLNEYAKLYLELIGISQVMQMEQNICYFCDFLVSPINIDVDNIPVQMMTVHHPLALQGINRLLRNAGILQREQTQKIYVSRGDVKQYRHIINEDKVSKLFYERGYREINSSKLNPLESLQMYSSAKIIAGPLGAGLVNSIFSKSKTKIISFQSRTYYDPLLQQIAYLLGHSYSVLGCAHFNSEDCAEGGARNSNYFVDIRKLDAILDLNECA